MVWKVRRFGNSWRTAFPLLTVMWIAGMAWAQGDDPGCALRVTGEDTGCSGAIGCANRTGCTFYDFHVACSGTYQLEAWMTCGEGENCGHCEACVTIYPSLGGGAVGGCYTGDIDQQCGQSQNCVNTCSVSLTSGYYRMQVCLVACHTGDYSACCQEYTCTAHGCVAGGGETCP